MGRGGRPYLRPVSMKEEPLRRCRRRRDVAEADRTDRFLVATAARPGYARYREREVRTEGRRRSSSHGEGRLLRYGAERREYAFIDAEETALRLVRV